MNAQTWTLIGAVAVAILSLIGGRQVAKIQAKSSPYDALAKRVVDLETADTEKGKELTRLRRALDALQEDFDILVPELIAWDEWITRGATPPPPIISPAAKRILTRTRPGRTHHTQLVIPDGNGNYRAAPDTMPPD